MSTDIKRNIAAIKGVVHEPPLHLIKKENQMKLVIADTEATATAIAPMYVEDKATIVVLSENIIDTIKGAEWTELCVAVSNEKIAVLGVKVRKEENEKHSVSLDKLIEWINELKWRYATSVEIKLDIIHSGKRDKNRTRSVNRSKPFGKSGYGSQWKPKRDNNCANTLDDFVTLKLPSETILNLPSTK